MLWRVTTNIVIALLLLVMLMVDNYHVIRGIVFKFKDRWWLNEMLKCYGIFVRSFVEFVGTLNLFHVNRANMLRCGKDSTVGKLLIKVRMKHEPINFKNVKCCTNSLHNMNAWKLKMILFKLCETLHPDRLVKLWAIEIRLNRRNWVWC